jgi:pimeloyl-ACP methyl ester carboxylesterase
MEVRVKNESGFEYVEEGEGEVLLLLHGLFGALSNWSDVLDTFSKKYKVVIPLMPIYTMPLKNTSVKGLADFVDSFIKFKQFEKVNLLGNSLGGHVALVVMRDYPQYVNSMVLTGSSGLYENAMGGSYPKRGDREYITEKVKYTFYDPATATEDLIEEVFEMTNNRLKVLKILAMAKTAIRHNMKDEIQNFDVPVCLIWGKQDKITPPEVAEDFHKLLPNSELHWVDKCGHAPMMEQGKAFNVILEDYLERLFSK